MAGTVLFLGSRPGALAAARRMGLTVFVLDTALPARRAARAVARHGTVPRGGGAGAAAVALCRGARVDAVVPLTEAAVLPAAEARSALGVAGMDVATALRCHDKVAMKEAVRAAGVACTDWVAVEEGTDADAVRTRLGLPLVVKERRLSGSRGMTLACDAAAARAALRPGMIAERFVEGTEMSLEVFVADGRVLFTNPTEYLVLAFANVAPAGIDAATRAAVEDLARRAVAALGFRRGMAHVELFLTAAGPVFGEMAARPPGGRIMRLLKGVYGFDPWEALLRLELGETPRLPPDPRRFAGVWMLHPGAGRVRSVTGLEAARTVPGVRQVVCRARPGADLAARAGTGQDVGWLEARGPTREAVVTALQQAHALVRIDLEPR